MSNGLAILYVLSYLIHRKVSLPSWSLVERERMVETKRDTRIYRYIRDRQTGKARAIPPLI